MNYEKTALGLSIIAILISAGSFVLLNNSISPMVSKVNSIEERLHKIETRSELFPGEWELYDMAKEDGEVTLYTMMDVEHIVQLFRGFSNRYPGIKTNYWQGGSSDVRARVFQEAEAEQESVDVVIGGGQPFQNEGVITEYSSVQMDDLLVKNPDMPVIFIYVYALGYNPTLLDEVPNNWEDLADQKYKGLIALRDPQDGSTGSGILACLWDYWGDQERFDNFLKGLKALEVPVHRSTSTMMRLVVSGEYSAAIPLFAHDVVTEKEEGVPIDYVQNVDPVCTMEGNAVIYKYSPNPNAAKLFIEWLLSTEGQNVLAELGRTPNRSGIASKVTVDAIYPNAKTVLSSPDIYGSDVNGWIEQYITPIWEAN